MFHSFLDELVEEHVSLDVVLKHLIIIHRVLPIVELNPVIVGVKSVAHVVTATRSGASMFDHAEQAIVSFGAHVTRFLEYTQLQLIAHVFVFYRKSVLEVDVLFLFD